MKFIELIHLCSGKGDITHTSKHVKIPLKVVIDQEKKRVVFAEANADFVDILFSFLTLPMATIVRLLTSTSSHIGSFNNLYQTAVNFDSKYFVAAECTDLLVNAKNAAEPECQKLKVNIDDSKPTDFFICPNSSCNEKCDFPSITTFTTEKCRHCGEFLNKPINYGVKTDDKGVFVSQTASFLITDDLHVFPNIMGQTLEIIQSSGITDFGVLEEKTLEFGSSEILDLLKYAILSKTPLTDLYFRKKNVISEIDDTTLYRSLTSTDFIRNFENMTVKVLVKKSTNKILLAQTAEDFVEFLFSFLAMSLARIIRSFDKNYPSYIRVENLYHSLSSLEVDRYLISEKSRDMLLYPELDVHYMWANNHTLYFDDDTIDDDSKYNSINGEEYAILTWEDDREMSFESPMLKKGFVRGPSMFMVTDDLVVTPLSSMSCITYLQSLKVPPSDVYEREIDIGVEEGLNLLRACLMSTSVLSNGLKCFISKEPKEEN